MPVPRPLLLASESSPPAAPGRDAPRTDFLELARRLGADVSYADTGGGLKPLERALALDLRQAWRASRREGVSLHFALSEKAGLPLALLPSRAPRVLVGHYLTSPKKRALHRGTGCLHRFDRIVVLCRVQERYLIEEAGAAPHKVRFVYDKVDARFWTPDAQVSVESDLVLSVGRERRDYETLMNAARKLPDLRFVIVASSPWSKGTEAQGREVPSNVTIQRGLSWDSLRDLYRRAAAAVVPLQAGCEYAAGVNALLEAMAMQKPLIVSHTPGIADYIEDGVNGLWAAAGNADALAAQIDALCRDRERGARLGRAARATIDNGRNLDTYLDRLTEIAAEVAPAPALHPKETAA